METPLNIVVTCTDRKSDAPMPSLRARDLPRGPDGTPDARAWLTRLSASDARRRPARRLYQGEAWSASVQLEATACRLRGRENVRMWVASAGYGLVSIDDLLAPYSATFSPEAPDYVGGQGTRSHGSEAARRWWRLLTGREGGLGSRSITRLALETPGDVLLVLSEAYLCALQPDVTRAVSLSDRVTIVSASAQRFMRLRQAAPPFDARLLTTTADRDKGVQRPIVSGTRISLNLRAAELLVRRFGAGPIDRKSAASYLEDLTERQAPLHVFEGRQQDDGSVKAFISDALAADANASKTRLLQEFRATGNKCEQKRFGALYDEVRAEREERETV